MCKLKVKIREWTGIDRVEKLVRLTNDKKIQYNTGRPTFRIEDALETEKERTNPYDVRNCST